MDRGFPAVAVGDVVAVVVVAGLDKAALLLLWFVERIAGASGGELHNGGGLNNGSEIKRASSAGPKRGSTGAITNELGTGVARVVAGIVLVHPRGDSDDMVARGGVLGGGFGVMHVLRGDVVAPGADEAVDAAPGLDDTRCGCVTGCTLVGMVSACLTGNVPF
jgi:hypothetical protein